MNPRLTYDIVHAAAQDAGNRSMRAAGRSSWTDTDYAAAVAETRRLVPSDRRWSLLVAARRSADRRAYAARSLTIAEKEGRTNRWPRRA